MDADKEAAAAGVSIASVGDYIALLKPRVMSLVVFTALTGLMMAPGSVHPVIGFCSLLAIAIGAGASGALNMWYDADIDAIMTRTKRRPIPAGRVAPGEALAFGMVLSVGSVLFLGLVANLVAAALLAFTILFYVVIYTMWLKRSTPQNIVIGGAAGALPPVIGWTAATGAIGFESVILFLIIFLWTPPHFWALALFKVGDYAAAGIPMMPNVAGPASTKRQILAYSLLLAPIGVLPWAFGFTSGFYGIVSAALGAGFIWHARKVLVVPDKEIRPAKALFAFSIFYLFAIFAILLADTIAMRAFMSTGG
ncbi:MAG: heme o synthase [Bradyrhizobium sp.]